jgi:Ca2+:H+ antiporter
LLPKSSPSLIHSPFLKLGIAWLVVVLFLWKGSTWLAQPMTVGVAIACFAALFGTILLGSFGVVREADHLAHELGEPYGTLILTLSIVSIEVILIAAVMLGPSDAPTIARDSIFAVMMIIMNLVTGLCLVAGAFRHGEQEYNAQGALAFVSMTLVLAGVGLILPNTLTTGNGTFWPSQAIAIGLLTAALYGAFLALQMGRYRTHFMQPPAGAMSIRPETADAASVASPTRTGAIRRKLLVHTVILLALMVPIVLLAHDLAVVIDYGVAIAGAPVAVGGVLIAIIVFTPESITAVKAALNNETQRAINLCLGAFVSTVGLTVPAVLGVGLVTGKTVIFGISPTETVLFGLTVGLTAMTYLGRRTSITQGLLHLMVFAVFTLMLFTS